MEPELRHYRTIVAIADHGGVTRAADALIASQPAITKHVRQIERWVGGAILRPVGRGVELTPLGLLMVEHGRHVLAAADQAMNAARAAARATRHEVILGFVPPMPASLTTQMVREAPQLLDCELTLRHLAWHQQVAAVVSHDVDLSLAYGPIEGFPRHDQVRHEPLYTETRVAGLCHDHPLAGEQQIDLEELAAEPVVRFPFNSEFWAVDPRPDGSRAPDGPFVNTLEEMLEAVATGATAFPTSALMHYIPRSDIRWIPLTGVPDATVSVIWTSCPDGSAIDRVRLELARRATDLGIVA